jgi:hypothetical protein
LRFIGIGLAALLLAKAKSCISWLPVVGHLCGIPNGLRTIANTKFCMHRKSAPQPFNKADARIDIPSSQFGDIRVDAEDVLPPNVPILDTDWDDIAPASDGENNWYDS